MGAINFSLDPILARICTNSLNINILVETGTYKGDTIYSLCRDFEKIISIEVSEKLWREACIRFKENKNVKLIHGSSAKQLKKIVSKLKHSNVLYWLDAHWCVGTNNEGSLSQCPLIKEIQAIGSLNQNSVILIDDARLFLSPPPHPHEISQWPRFHDVIQNLYSKNKNHELIVINDVICFVPTKIIKDVELYAQKNGFDLLSFIETHKTNWLIEAEKKEQTIIQLNSNINKLNILNSNYKQELEYLQSNQIINQENISNLTDKIKEISICNQDKTKVINDLSQKNNELLSEIDLYKQQKFLNEKEIKSLENETITLLHNNEDLEKNLCEEKNKSNNLLQKIDLQTQKINALEQHISIQDLTLSDRLASIDKLSREINSFKDKIIQKNEIIDDHERVLKVKSNNISILETKIDDQLNSFLCLEKKLSEQNFILFERQCLIDSLSQEIQVYKSHFSEKCKENSNLLKEIEEKKRLIDELNYRFMSDINELKALISELDSQYCMQKQLLEQSFCEIKNNSDFKSSLIEQKDIELQEKEKVIQEQANALRFFINRGGFLKNKWNNLKILTKRIIKPRLGNLNQYPPRRINPNIMNQRKLILSTYPKISIVTPSYNQGSFIEKTILSVIDQNYPNLEYYVQDGLSQDTTIEVLKRHHNNITGWVTEKDSGQSQAINRGFGRTSGEIMAWINSDDILLPNALFIVAEYFNLHPDIDVVYGNRLLINENDQEIGRWILPGHDNDVLSWADYVPQETLFWRRSIWEASGASIDETFRFAMDWDLIIRFRDAGAKFSHIPKFLGAFRVHTKQKTSSSIHEIGFDEMNRVRFKSLGRVPSYHEINKNIRKYLIKHTVVDMRYRFFNYLNINSE